MLADEDEYGAIDAAEWKKIERQGDPAIKRWIDDQLEYTSVTVVLIGAETAERDWVDYEIRRSWERGNALVGLRIHNIKNQEGKTDALGSNPLDGIYLSDGTPLSAMCTTYDWVANDGRSNLGTRVESAFQNRAAYKGETVLKTSAASATVSVSQSRPAKPTIIRNPSPPWTVY